MVGGAGGAEGGEGQPPGGVTLMMAAVASVLRVGWWRISSSTALPRLEAVSPGGGGREIGGKGVREGEGAGDGESGPKRGKKGAQNGVQSKKNSPKRKIKYKKRSPNKETNPIKQKRVQSGK